MKGHAQGRAMKRAAAAHAPDAANVSAVTRQMAELCPGFAITVGAVDLKPSVWGTASGAHRQPFDDRPAGMAKRIRKFAEAQSLLADPQTVQLHELGFIDSGPDFRP
jgi:hypothetical protein